MSRLQVVPIVEGHGETQAIGILLRRIGYELLGGKYIDVLKPIRQPRTKLVRSAEPKASGPPYALQSRELGHALDLAMLKLNATSPDVEKMILILIDADEDPSCKLGPDLLSAAQSHRPDADVACVLATMEYVTWFVAGAESLTRFLELGGEEIPRAPEEQRCRKAWIEKRFRNHKYSETVDQPAMTAALDLALCRRRSPSFDKLCRELEARLREP